MSADVVLVDLAGLAAIGAIVWYFFLSRRPDEAAAAEAGGVQEVRVVVKGGYSPDRIVAHPGLPLRLHFDRQEESHCSEEVVFPDFGVRRHLPAFATTTIDLPARPAGSYAFACGMDMLHGTLVLGDAALESGPARDRREGHGSEHRETDPICGMAVLPERAAATSARGGRTYYFCSVGCQERFDAGLPPRSMAASGEQRVSLGVRPPTQR
ncbi:MAG TPA: cupredoxin domain-containing protein [Vicinamibacteria bacterium]|nr:cupredoxin domain-containing protein [Vicinamibacteria bacterium]